MTLRETLQYHARERRGSLAGFPELHRTLQHPIPTTPVEFDGFPDLTSRFSFRTKIRVTGASPTGLIFELGNATTAIAAFVTATTLVLRAGDAAAADRALATFTPAGGWATSRELDLLFAVQPGEGRVRIYGDGLELARDQSAGDTITAGSFVVGERYTIATIGTTDFTLIGAASNTVGLVFTATGVGSGTGTATEIRFPNGWSAGSDGAFAAAAVGVLPADVTETGAPTDFDVIDPLSVYLGQVPRHFI